jgi:hypothetical protein
MAKRLPISIVILIAAVIIVGLLLLVFFVIVPLFKKSRSTQTQMQTVQFDGKNPTFMYNIPPNLTDFNITLSDLSPATIQVLSNTPILSITGQTSNVSKPYEIYGFLDNYTIQNSILAFALGQSSVFAKRLNDLSAQMVYEKGYFNLGITISAKTTTGMTPIPCTITVTYK